MLSSTNPEIQDLVDRTAIQDVVYNYTHAIDGRDEALFASLWAPDAVWDFVGNGGLGTLTGFEAIMDGFRKSAASGRQMHHFSTNLVIDINGDRASGRSKSVTTGQNLPLFVSYDDEYVRLEGKWMFGRRDVRAHLPDTTQ